MNLEIDAFMYFPSDFERKINKLIDSLGENYIEIIESDVSDAFFML